jgi:hypothetical protein
MELLTDTENALALVVGILISILATVINLAG